LNNHQTLTPVDTTHIAEQHKDKKIKINKVDLTQNSVNPQVTLISKRCVVLVQHAVLVNSEKLSQITHYI